MQKHIPPLNTNNQATHTIALTTQEKYISNLIELVSITPNIPNALFLLYSDDYSQPTKLLNSYKTLNTKYLNDFGMFCSITQINGEDTMVYGLNKSFLCLMKLQEKLTDRHLMLLYLFRKFQKIKFCFCFDKTTITDTAFREIKNSFDQLLFFIDFTQLEDFRNSFMLMVYHAGGNENVVTIGKNRLKKSIKEGDFYKENHKIIQKIVQEVVKKVRIFQLLNSLKGQEMHDKKIEFEKMVSQLQPISLKQSQKRLPINQRFLNALQEKSSEWKFFNSLLNAHKKEDLSKTQTSTSEMKNDEKKSQLKGMFTIWDDFFSKFVKFIPKKQQKSKTQASELVKQGKFLPLSSSKYSLQLSQLSSKQLIPLKSNKPQSFTTAKLLSKILTRIKKIRSQKDKFTDQKFKPSNEYFVKSLKEFIKLFYESGVIDPTHNKIFSDYYMIFYQLLQLWQPIRDPKNRGSSFFDQANLMMGYLPDMQVVRFLVDNLVRVFVFQVQMDLIKFRKGELVRIQKLEVPVNKIKELLNDPHCEKFERLRLTIELYKLQMTKVKIRQLENKPYQKVLLVLELLEKCGVEMLEKKELLKVLGKSLQNHIKEHKVNAHGINIVSIMVRLLEMGDATMQEVLSVYESEFYSVIKRCKQQSSPLTQQQQQFIQSYIDYLIKLGLAQRARLRSHLISSLDQQLSRRLLVKSLLKSNAKRQMQFINGRNNDKSLSEEKKENKVQEIKEVLKEVREFLNQEGNNARNEMKKHEDDLIDI